MENDSFRVKHQGINTRLDNWIITGSEPNGISKSYSRKRGRIQRI